MAEYSAELVSAWALESVGMIREIDPPEEVPLPQFQLRILLTSLEMLIASGLAAVSEVVPVVARVAPEVDLPGLPQSVEPVGAE